MDTLSAILFWAGAAIVSASVFAAVRVLWRRLPTVALVNPSAAPVNKAVKKKEEIIADRIIRQAMEKAEPVKKFFRHLWELVRGRFRRLAHYAFELEKKSERLARREWDALTAATRMHALAREADALVKDEKYVEAEKKYIEALSIEQKNPKLYEKLGRLYLRVKQYDQARDTFRFASRLAPNDASVVAYLGEVAMARGERADAVTYFQHATALRPRSPRYLDLLIESAIAAKDAPAANDALAKLAEVNPENAKLAEFYRRIKALA